MFLNYGKSQTLTKVLPHSINIITSIYFVCLFVWRFSSHSRMFYSFQDVTITGEGLQILMLARHSWPLSSKRSLTCHTYCDTRSGPSLHHCHLRGPVNLTPFAVLLTEELSLPVLTMWVCPDRGSNLDLPHARRTPYLYTTAAVIHLRFIMSSLFS